MFFYKFKIQLLIVATVVSNIAYAFCVMFVLGHSKTKDRKNDSSFARIRTIVLISVFL